MLAHALGINPPRGALIAAVEVVNPEMEIAVEDAIIAKMADRGQIKGAIVDGPLALDNAVSEEAPGSRGSRAPCPERPTCSSWITSTWETSCTRA